MACWREKLHVGEALLAMAGSGVTAAVGSPTVILTAGAAAALVAASAAYEEAMYDLAVCLNNADREEDAAKARAHADNVKVDIQTLQAAYDLIRRAI